MTTIPIKSVPARPDPMTDAAIMAIISDLVPGLAAGWSRHGKVKIGPNGLEWPQRCDIHPLWRAFAVRIHATLQQMPQSLPYYRRIWRNEAAVLRAKVRQIEWEDTSALLDYYRALVIADQWVPSVPSRSLTTHEDIHGLTIEVDWNHDGVFDADDVTVTEVYDPAEWAERVAETYPGEIMDPDEYVRREIEREDPIGFWGAIDALDRS